MFHRKASFTGKEKDTGKYRGAGEKEEAIPLYKSRLHLILCAIQIQYVPLRNFPPISHTFPG